MAALRQKEWTVAEVREFLDNAKPDDEGICEKANEMANCMAIIGTHESVCLERRLRLLVIAGQEEIEKRLAARYEELLLLQQGRSGLTLAERNEMNRISSCLGRNH